MDESVIRVVGLKKSFGETEALAGVDFELSAGSVVGLVGRNGSGKSTLMKCMLGLLRPTGGGVRVFGENPWELSASAKGRLGYVPQEPTLYPWMTAGQLTRYHGAFYPTWNQRFVDSIMQRWQIDAGKRIGPMSPGEYQKVAIVLALGHEPELLLLDEPAAALDPIARREFLETLLELIGERDCTILFSTHLTNDVERVADRVAIMQAGRVVLHDELGRLKDSVKRLVLRGGSPPPADFSIPGLLRRVDGDGAIEFCVTRFDADLPGRLRGQLGGQVDVRSLNLEEIFLELHHATR